MEKVIKKYLSSLPLRAFVVGTVFLIIFSYTSIWATNRLNTILAATQFSCLSVMFSLFIILVLNPFLKLCRIKTFTRREIFIILIIIIVPAGLPNYGYLGQVIPLATGLYDPTCNTQQAEWSKNLIPYVDKKLFLKENDVEAIKNFHNGLRAIDKHAFPVFLPSDTQTWTAYFKQVSKYINDPEYRQKRSFWGDVPWKVWVMPIINWLGMGLIFILLFYALNEIVFLKWYKNEKLIFPIGELMREIFGVEQDQKFSVPPIFNNFTFWIGFSISFLIILYNGLVNGHYFENLVPIILTGKINFQDTALEGIRSIHCEIIFVVIGLAFLLPKDISFSVWFFYLIMKCELFIANLIGYVPSGSNWHSNCNFIVAQGGGAMEMFGIICLWKVRYNILAVFLLLIRPKGNKSITAEEVKQYTIPSFLFFLSSGGFIYFFMRGGLSFWMSLFAFLMLLFIIVAVVRIVAECGMISFKTYFGPIHIIKSFGLIKFTSIFTSGALGPLVIIISVMFWDLKCFIAPTMINAKFISEKEDISNNTFAFSVFWGVILTLIASTIFTLLFVYEEGTGSMNRWFFQEFPKTTLNLTSSLIETGNTLNKADIKSIWVIIGSIICGGLFYLRQFFFWIPHPIGLVMYVCRITNNYWFSFFLAWIFKKTAIKYCNHNTYKIIRALFIGLILGEITAIALSYILGFCGFENMYLSLNRS